MPLEQSLPGSGADDWFPVLNTNHRQAKTIGTTAELEGRPDSIQLFSPSSEVAVTSDPILGGELVIRVIDAQVLAQIGPHLGMVMPRRQPCCAIRLLAKSCVALEYA